MTWDPRRLARAVLAIVITASTMVLLILTAVGKATSSEALAVVAGFQGIVLAFYFKPDKDE